MKPQNLTIPRPIRPARKGTPSQKPKGKNGQTLVEYALILAFISVVAISVLAALGKEVNSVFTTISSQLAVAKKGKLG